jgi:hypothetical protein
LSYACGEPFSLFLYLASSRLVSPEDPFHSCESAWPLWGIPAISVCSTGDTNTSVDDCDVIPAIYRQSACTATRRRGTLNQLASAQSAHHCDDRTVFRGDYQFVPKRIRGSQLPLAAVGRNRIYPGFVPEIIKGGQLQLAGGSKRLVATGMVPSHLDRILREASGGTHSASRLAIFESV